MFSSSLLASAVVFCFFFFFLLAPVSKISVACKNLPSVSLSPHPIHSKERLQSFLPNKKKKKEIKRSTVVFLPSCEKKTKKKTTSQLQIVVIFLQNRSVPGCEGNTALCRDEKSPQLSGSWKNLLKSSLSRAKCVAVGFS